MKNWKSRKISTEIWYSTFYLVILSTVVILAIMYAKIMLEKSTEQRVYYDLNTKAQLHRTIIDKSLKENFDQMHAISRLWNPEKSKTENLDSMWQFIEETDEFTNIGFADLNGNAETYKGEKIGNISRTTYFSNIINGKTKENSEYVESTPMLDSPQLILSIPVYDEDKIIGVLFKSKDIVQVEEALIDDIHFKGQASMLIVDSKGKILAVNREKNFNLLYNNIFENGDHIISEDFTEEQLQHDLKSHKAGKGTLVHDKESAFAVYIPILINDWTLICMVDKEIVIKNYFERMQFIKWIIMLISVMFLFCLIFSLFMMYLYFRSKKYRQDEHDNQYLAYKRIMHELNCPIYEYRVETDSIVGNKEFHENYSYDIIDSFQSHVEVLKKQHPEYNFEGMISAMRNAIENKKICSFETVFRQKDGIPCWNKSIMIPVCNSKDQVISIFVTVMDNTPAHELFENTMAMMSAAPLSLCRYYLSEPMHIEYLGKGMRRMLGYTQEELNRILGNEQDYANLLVEEDRKTFYDFVKKLVKKDGVANCEYRILCKDGTEIDVFDTMEVKTGADGIKYGYSIVMDISKYHEDWKKDKKKLKELEIQLNEARIKISTGQMQPHFLYNSLASIREIILDDPEYASDLIFDFTTHLRACIKSMSSEARILFTQELENIKAYVNIEKMRFGNKLQVTYNIEESDFYIIPLSVQPLVENAIRHGIYERGNSGGKVEVSSHREGNCIIIKVKDNGIGFNVSTIQNEVENYERDSTGLRNLCFRFEKLMLANVQIESKIGAGTCITIRIPVKGEEKNENNYCR